MPHSQQELAHPEQFPFQYRVRVYGSRIAEILRTPDAEMVIGVWTPSPLQAAMEVFDWCCLTSASSVVVHAGTDFSFVPQVYVDCRYEDGKLFVSRLNGAT